MSSLRFYENLKVKMIIIDNFEINLSFQFHICNSLFEKTALKVFFKLADCVKSIFQSSLHQVVTSKVLNGQYSKIDQIL